MRRILPFLVLCAAVFQANCAGVTGGSSIGTVGTPPPSPPKANVAVSVSPNTVTLRASAVEPFTATVTGSSNTAVIWQVNNVTGGAASSGTISASGIYTAPPTVPSPNAVTVQAVSVAEAS